MPDKSPTILRLDPSPSRVFSWLEFEADASGVTDDRGRVIRPASSVLRVKYRYDGAIREFWPVSEEEAREVFNPGAKFGFSIGSAFGQLIKPYKSSRLAQPGEKPVKVEKKVERRWLA